ncbi:MAG: hypothetical protein KGI06_05375 [Candidatus Micrarchaeota archaeon]|nr:hypothetical protein [Candidatus Micrarchaeota archaeon]
MAYVAIFVIIALLEIISAILVFVFKNILHIVLALSSLFIFNSAMFFVLGQPLLALLQVFIMVGGISTYIFIGVAAGSYSKFRGTNYAVLAIVYVAIFALFSVKVMQSGIYANAQNTLTSVEVSQSLLQNSGLLYFLAIMLFGTGFGSILLMKKLGRKK